MRPQTSTDYDVDNRYRGVENAVDNKSGAKFLQKYLERKRTSDIDRVGNKKEQEGRFVLGGMGGTVSVAQMPNQITNTDAKYSFKNTFRVSQS
jgi:hypothetical protein